MTSLSSVTARKQSKMPSATLTVLPKWWGYGSTQPRLGTQHTIHPSGVLLEEVESFKYLGSSFTATDQAKDKISGRIILARSAFTCLKSALWSGREISLKTKGRDVACAC